MKIINIVEEGRFGGPQKRIIEVAKGLQKKEVETVVVFPKNDSEAFQKLLVENGIAHHALPLHRLTKDLGHLLKYGFYFFYEIYLLIQLFRKEKATVVHCNGSYQMKGVIAAKLAGIPSVWHMNDTFVPSYIKVVFKIVKTFFAHTFVAASHRTAAYYFPQKAKKITILPAPIKTNQFSPDSVQLHPEITKFKGIKVVTVGNINPVKGYDTLVEAVKLVNGKYSKPIQFIAVGRLLENQKKYIENLKKIKEKHQLHNFHFWGASNEVKEILKAADIYVCCSDFEASPISVWEALSMAKPTVSTDVGDIETIFNEQKCGVVVPAQNPEKLAEAIIKLADDSEKQKELSKIARQTAIDFFDIKICVENHFNIYKRVTRTV